MPPSTLNRLASGGGDTCHGLLVGEGGGAFPTAFNDSFPFFSFYKCRCKKIGFPIELNAPHFWPLERLETLVMSRVRNSSTVIFSRRRKINSI